MLQVNKEKLLQQDRGSSKKRCSFYDSDCDDMEFMTAIKCFTDCWDRFGGPADGYCPIIIK